jgi:hypothetical protein
MASGSDVRVAYVAESAFGTTPATPSFATMRTTSGELSTTKQTVTSDERRSDKNVVDELQTGQDVEGSYAFELAYGAFDDLIEAVLGGTWSSDVIQNGITQRSFTFEETLELGATDSYRRFAGCRLNTLSLSVTAREKITGSFGIMGRQETLAEAIVTGATYGAANAEEIMTAGASVGSLSVGSLSGLPLRSLSLSVNRNMRRRPVVASLYTDELNDGMVDVTGEVEAYFESNAAYQAVLDHETAAISANLGHDANKKYTVSIPRARWTDGSVVLGGGNDDVMVRMPFRGTLSTDHSIEITRAVA